MDEQTLGDSNNPNPKAKRGRPPESARRDFARRIDPLERLSSSRLGQPYRDKCTWEWIDRPEAVQRVIDQTLADADPARNPIGLFAHRIVKGRWHEQEPLAPPGADPDFAFYGRTCPRCGVDPCMCDEYERLGLLNEAA